MIFVSTTIKNKDEAEALVDEVINAKLAACADFWPVQSVYNWEGEKQSVAQYLIVFTTHNVQAPELEARIIAKHPYAVPMIARTNVDQVNNAYQLWVNETLGM